MARTSVSPSQAALFAIVIACLCLQFLESGVYSERPRGTESSQGAPQELQTPDLLGVLDCATRPDQLLAVRPDSYGVDSFRLAYVYPVPPGHDANMLNALRPTHWVALMLYNRDSRFAALFEVGFGGPRSRRTFTLLDGANLENEKGHWVVKNILNGGGSTWPEIARHTDQVTSGPPFTVPRTAVKRTNAVCQFPLSGLTFVAVSVSGDRSNWNFKDGLSEGVRFQSQTGPFKNTDLKRTPASTIFMNTYGPS
jgi:hypothetical protein